MRALIDYDVITYLVGFASEHSTFKVYLRGTEAEFGAVCVCKSMKEVRQFIADNQDYYWVKDIQPEPLAYCLHSVKITIQSILEAVGATSYTGFLTGKQQFREQVATIKPYKGNRDPFHKPVHYDNIKKYLIDQWNAEVVDYYEADDALAMAQWEDYKTSWEETSPPKLNTILCTIDKDLDQVPGWHYHFRQKEKYWVSKQEATRFFYEQILSGDPTDNIQGIPGVGAITAKKILKDCVTEEQLWNAVKQKYVEYYKNEEVAMDIITETAKLVYMVKEKGVEWCVPTFPL